MKNTCGHCEGFDSKGNETPFGCACCKDRGWVEKCLDGCDVPTFCYCDLGQDAEWEAGSPWKPEGYAERRAARGGRVTLDY